MLLSTDVFSAFLMLLNVCLFQTSNILKEGVNRCVSLNVCLFQRSNILEEGVLQNEEMLYAWNLNQRATPKALKQYCRLKIQEVMGIEERDRPADKILKADLPLPICLLDYLCVRMI